MKVAPALSRWIMRQWLIRGWFSRLTQPLACFAHFLVQRKQAAYRSGQRTATHPGIPVIVIGNIFVGGTGKTPVVIAVTRYLQARGYTPGVLSRGYGIKTGAAPRVGLHSLDATQFGDEPTLINRQTGAPVAVHPIRVQAAQALREQCPSVDVIVCDDGLQHLALARDVEIIVQDQRGVGNGLMLPAGPLREPQVRLDQVAAVVTNFRAQCPPRATPPNAPAHLPSHASDPRHGPIQVAMTIAPGLTRHLDSDSRRSLAQWAELSRHTRIAAVAGIGQPGLFFDMLTQAGIALSSTISLVDHADFERSPFDAIDADAILVTSKDAVKCALLHEKRIWEVPIEAAFDPPDFLDTILNLPAPSTHRT